jgi:DNA polymerase sigma
MHLRKTSSSTFSDTFFLMNTLPAKPAHSIPTTETRRDRRRREKSSQPLNQPEARSSQIDDRDPPVQNPSSSNGVNIGGSSTEPHREATFSGGDDFIPFVFSDESLDEYNTGGRKDKHEGSRGPDSSSRVNGRDKGKAVVRDDKPPKTERAKPNGRDRTPPTREWDKGKVGESSRDGARRRDNPREQDRNRGKRKHEMIFDLDDGYSNKKQRTDASSRKAPWVAGVDWDKCNNVAEMCVSSQLLVLCHAYVYCRLHCEVQAFTKWISPTPVEDEVRGLIVSLISKAVTAAFPDAQVHPFGSFETKLYLPLG